MSYILNPGFLHVSQIVVSVILVTLILMQVSSAGVGSALGGASGGEVYHTKRGFEKFLFIATIVVGILFAGLCVLAVLF